MQQFKLEMESLITEKNTANMDSCNFKALNGTAETRVIPAEGLNNLDPVTFLKHRYEEIKDVIKQNIKE